MRKFTCLLPWWGPSPQAPPCHLGTTPSPGVYFGGGHIHDHPLIALMQHPLHAVVGGLGLPRGLWG